MKPKRFNRLSPRSRKWLLWIAAAFCLYSLVGFCVLPAIIKWQLLKLLPGVTERRVAVRQVKLNPWTFSLTVRGLALTEPEGRPFASWDELYVNFQASSLFRWAWTFKEIRLVKPIGEVILLEDGRLNFANMLTGPTNAPPKPNEPASIPRINIFHLAVTNGFVALEDRTRRSPFRTEYRPINLHLRNFTTRPHSETPYSFRAESDAGRSLTWAGDLTVQPLESAGHLEITGAQLPRYQPYLEDFTRAILTNGLADVQLDYGFAANTNGFDLEVTNAGLRVTEVQVLDPDTREIIGALRGFNVQGARFSLRERALRCGAVKVSEAMLLLRLKPDGHLNLLDLLAPPSPATNLAAVSSTAVQAAPPPTVAMDEFTVDQTAVRFEDLTRQTPFRTELKPVEVSVKGFSTKPGTAAQYSFHLSSEAAETLEGAGSFSISPLSSRGEVSVNAVDLKKYLPYAENFFRGKIVGGKLAVRVPYRVAQEAAKLQGSVTNASLSLTNLELQMPESAETVTRIRQIAFEGVDANLDERRGRVGLFRGHGGSVVVRRGQDGTINLLTLLAGAPTNAPPARAAETGPTNRAAYAIGGWTLNVDEIQLDDYALKLEDLKLPKPASFLLDQLTVNLKGLSTASNRLVTAKVGFRVNEAGTVAARGTAMLAPLFADVDVDLKSLDLRAAQPYVEQFVGLGIVSGALSTAGKVHFQTNDSSAPLLTFTGALGLSNLVTTDQVLFKEFVRWDDLAVKGIDAALAPNRLKIDEVLLARPSTSLLIGTNHQLNLSLILRKETKDTTVTKTVGGSAPTTNTIEKTSSDLFPVQLGTLTLDHAAFAFADESVQPRVALGVEELSGTIRGLSSALDKTAEVNLSGKIDAQSPFFISGRVSPLSATRLVDLTITNANTQLTPVSGYLEKFAGYPLKKGLLSTSLRYRIEGATLRAENKIAVDQFTLGPHNNNPDASKLPLKLGVALLKDSNGRIALDLPIEGNLDDPKFRLGPIVLQVLVNVIVKAATSPFKMLGALAGGGGEELSYVEFEPGTTNPVAGEVDKLGKLAAALAKRPALNLEIEGAIDPNTDRAALARQKLAENLKASRQRELAAKGRAPASIATFQIEPQERERLLRAAFVEQFGTNIAKIIQTNLARLTGTNQPADMTAAKAPAKSSRNFLQGIAGVFGVGSGSGDRVGKNLPKADREALDLATPEVMEQLLAERTEVTEEDLRQLMTARSRWVQDWLVQNGQTTADRLFLVTPKPVDAAYRGECRSNLSLN